MKSKGHLYMANLMLEELKDKGNLFIENNGILEEYKVPQMIKDAVYYEYGNKIEEIDLPMAVILDLKNIDKIKLEKYNLTYNNFVNTNEYVYNKIIEDLNSSDDVDIDIKATAEDLFSIMFTSGTTGLPKGVMITNHQISGLIIAFKNIFYFFSHNFSL